MSDEVCTIENVGAVVKRVCVQHGKLQIRAGKSLAQRAAQKAARTLRSGSATPVRSGVYAAGFSSRKTMDSDDSVEYTVGNAGARASLVHLLEHGHQLFYFGRPTHTRTRAFPHIEPAFEAGAEVIRRASVS